MGRQLLQLPKIYVGYRNIEIHAARMINAYSRRINKNNLALDRYNNTKGGGFETLREGKRDRVRYMYREIERERQAENQETEGEEFKKVIYGLLSL